MMSVIRNLCRLRNSLNENRLFNIVQGTSTVPVVTGSNAAGLSEILHGTFIEKKGLDGETSRIPVSNLMRQTFAEDLKTLVAARRTITTLWLSMFRRRT